MASKYAYKHQQTLVRTNSATKIQARVRGARARDQSKKRTTNTNKNYVRQQRRQLQFDGERNTLVRTNSATKIQARVRGARTRTTARRHKQAVVEDIVDDNDSVLSSTDDPELDRLKQRRNALRTKYRDQRERGENGKMQLTLLDFDIADKEYRMALAYRIQAAKGVENREYRGMLACACLPCLLILQFLCCTSTGAVGERRKTVKERDETIQKLKSLGNDYMQTKQLKIKKTPRVRQMKR